MKKTLCIIAAAAALAACTKAPENEVSQSGLKPNQFGAVASDNTRVSIDADWKLSWEAGDLVNISDGISVTQFKALSSGSTTVLEADDFAVEESKQYFAVYPASESNVFAAGKVSLSVPSNQKAVAGEYPECPAVAVTTGADRNFVFKNVCGLVSFEITEVDVKSVVLFAPGDEYVSGEIEVDCADASFTVKNGVKGVTVENGAGLLPPGRYYVAILPGTYSSGLSLSIYKQDGTRVRRNLTLAGAAIWRSKYLDLEKADDGRTWKTEYTIKNGQELAAFLSVADKCSAETVVTLANDIDMEGSGASAVSFAGTFDGGNFSLNNYKGSAPLFAELKAGAAVRNLVIGESCVFNYTAPGRAASIVGDNHGTLTACENKAKIVVSGEAADGLAGGIAAFSDGSIAGCINSGAIEVNGALAAVGGVVGKAVGAEGVAAVTGSTNGGAISAQGAVPAIGGVAAIVETGDIVSCTNNGGITVAPVSSIKVLKVGGIGGSLSGIVSGSSTNNGEITINNDSAQRTMVGGVIGQSSSKFNTVYNKAPVTVDLAQDGGQVMLGGVAGYMDGSGLPTKSLITGQNSGSVKLSGGLGNESKEVFYVAGVVGNTTIPNVSHTNTSWATCNTNHGSIEVNVPLTVYVGGVFGRVTGTKVYAATGNVTGAKNDGSITVNAPGPDSCIGGIVARHGRGRLGNANGFGQAAKGASITVTGADKSVSVGAYAGWVSSDNGGDYPTCCMYISGISCYGSVQAEGATAGVLIGKAQLTGNSTTNGIMLGSAASEKPKIASGFLFNGTEIDDPASDKFDVTTFFGSIVPSATTSKNKTDGTSLKGIYYFCSAGEKTEVSYKDGIIKK